jgi:hypothetical protein
LAQPETFVADIFQEVDEEVRRERLLQLWQRHQTLIVGIIVLVILGIGGFRGYQWWEAKKAAEAGATFEQAITLANEGKHAESEAAFAEIAKSGGGSYPVLARLREAAELAATDRPAGVKLYDGVGADTSVSSTLRDLAKLRAAMLLLDTAAFAEMKDRLEPLAAPDRPFHHTARELLAFAAWRGGDTTALKKWVETIITDPTSPSGTRSRAEMLLTLAAPDLKS